MKWINYFSKSLSRQVVLLMGTCIFLFIMGTGILLYMQQKTNDEYIDNRSEIIAEQKNLTVITERFNTVIFEMRGYIAFDKPQMKDHALSQESEIRSNLSELEGKVDQEELLTYTNMVSFTNYYFDTVIPPVITAYEKGNKEEVVELANNEVTERVEDFRNETKAYSLLLVQQLEKNTVNFSEKQSSLLMIYVSFSILFLILLQFTIRMIIKNIGKPLSDFVFAANELAAGREAVITVNPDRVDELGALSVAFRKMVESLQEKEQDLVAHNEELIAQQDELQAQQNELQETLVTLTENEEKLIRRNELINGISTSLNKEEVLQSIVESMCHLIGADRGMITIIDEEFTASFGISDYGISQFRENMKSGLNQRLFSAKKAFTVKREQQVEEKGYHEMTNYSYDLYIPILSAYEEVEAIMVFSRFGDAFTDKEIIEFETLTRQIAISLEKIKLYDQSENNRRLNQDILNTVQEGIQLIDKESKIVQVNKQLCEIFTCNDKFEEMIGLPWNEWSNTMAESITEQDFLHSLEGAIQASGLRPNEEHSFIYQKKDSNRVIKVYCKTLRYSEEEFGTVLVHRDITKEYEVDQMKSEFVSTVSHELRTPLASVLGFTELMLTKELKPERKMKYLQTIYNEAKRLTALINDFLDVQRMESGKQTYEKKYIDVLPILQKVIEHQEINTSLHRINLQIDSESTYILGDKNKIEQVFTNLLSNSIKYSPNGGNIWIRAYASDGMVAFDIKDEGLGIPKEALANLFQKFYRVDNSDRRRIGGTGLGLAIVEEIVKAHSGRISVHSEYGEGSVFTINFPTVNMKEGGRNLGETTSQLSYNIMVIEDDLSLTELLSHELLDSGFHVRSYKNGAEALEQAKMITPDAIVLDILLGEDEMDGWTFMQELKSCEKLNDIPIFISTALDEKERGFSLGAQGYLVKPYKPSQLSKVIMLTLLNKGNQEQIMVP